MRTLKILHLYPDRMNIYGDRGNLICLQKRLEWREIKSEITQYSIGDIFPSDFDIVFIGGGQDSNQLAVAKDLQNHAAEIRDFVESGGALLSICGGYQLLGKSFTTAEGVTMPGINIFNVVTKATQKRMIGNMVCSNTTFGKIVGFENHSGETTLMSGAHELGEVIVGFGNSFSSKKEGVWYKNAIGSYLHGPLLPKNPKIADYLLQTACSAIDNSFVFPILNDSEENAANSNASKFLLH